MNRGYAVKSSRSQFTYIVWPVTAQSAAGGCRVWSHKTIMTRLLVTYL